MKSITPKLNEFMDEVAGLLEQVLFDCGKYGYKIEGMSDDTLRRVQSYMGFDDSE